MPDRLSSFAATHQAAIVRGLSLAFVFALLLAVHIGAGATYAQAPTPVPVDTTGLIQGAANTFTEQINDALPIAFTLGATLMGLMLAWKLVRRFARA